MSKRTKIKAVKSKANTSDWSQRSSRLCRLSVLAKRNIFNHAALRSATHAHTHTLTHPHTLWCVGKASKARSQEAVLCSTSDRFLPAIEGRPSCVHAAAALCERLQGKSEWEGDRKLKGTWELDRKQNAKLPTNWSINRRRVEHLGCFRCTQRGVGGVCNHDQQPQLCFKVVLNPGSGILRRAQNLTFWGANQPHCSKDKDKRDDTQKEVGL